MVVLLKSQLTVKSIDHFLELFALLMEVTNTNVSLKCVKIICVVHKTAVNVYHTIVAMTTGQWPMIINIQSGLSAGNHSVIITARDILGLTADTTLNYLLEEEVQSRKNRMTIATIIYTTSVPNFNVQNVQFKWLWLW